MVTNMITGEQSKVDKAEQKKQTQVWQQEIYRDVIKDVKGLYDKYFSATSSDYILSSKVFSSITINSSKRCIRDRYGVDSNLVKAIIKTESNFEPNVVSSAGAKGLMQLMPENCRDLGVEDPFNIETVSYTHL